MDGKKDVRAVIELKGAKVSLDVRQKRVGDTRTPVEQAFNNFEITKNEVKYIKKKQKYLKRGSNKNVKFE